ncbi:MAG: TRAP transporter small permease subunit [Desulfovermiculus sp.]
MHRIERIIQELTLRLAQIGQAALVMVMLIIVVNILIRAVWKPLPGSYEMVEILGAVILSMGVAYCAVHKGHVAVSFLVDMFSPRKRAVIDFFTNLVFCSVITYVSWGMIEYAGKMYSRGRATTSLDIPLYPVYYLVGFGLVLLAAVVVMQLLRSVMEIIRKGDNT